MDKIINPREMLKMSGRDSLFQFLQIRGGYVPQEAVFNSLCNLLWNYLPLLGEGERGTGKTALGEAVADAFNLKLFYMQCHSQINVYDVIGEWDRAIQDFAAKEMRADKIATPEIRRKLLTKEYFNFGEVILAFEYAASAQQPAVLIIDEIDKLDERGEDFLLQILARGYARIPRMQPDSRVGFLPELGVRQKFLSYPIIFLTSNNMRSGVSSPLRSRCRYVYYKTATQQEMIEILLARMPLFAAHDKQELYMQFVRLIDAIQGLTLQEKPAIREFLDFGETLLDPYYQIKTITKDVLLQHIGAFAKSRKDVEVFEKRSDGLVEDANKINRKLINGKRSSEYVTAEEIVGRLLDRRYEMETNCDKFIIGGTDGQK